MIIYLTIFLILLLCILVYDLGGTKQYREAHIRLILFALVLVSGLSYRLGGDGIGNMLEYKVYGNISDLSFKYLIGFQGKQPGYVLLCTLCKTITDDYFLFKLVHAIIINTAYVNAIRANVRYTFSGLMVYFILIYFNQNFQLIRESFAIAFFLLSLTSFYQNKWKKYYFYVFIAFLFHEGALFLVILPLIKYFGFNYKTIIFYFALFGLLFIYSSDILQYLSFLSTSGEITNDKYWYYFHEVDSDSNFSSISTFVFSILIPLLIIFYYKRRNINIPYLFPAIISLGIYITSAVLPIVYRFGNYVMLFNYVLITDFIFTWFSHNIKRQDYKLRIVVILFLFFTFIGLKSMFYFGNYGETRFKEYVQYYPYASVIEKYEDPEREALFKQLLSY